MRANENKGAWWYNTQLDSYLAVQPGSTAPAESEGGMSTSLIVAIVVAAVIVILLIVLVMRRRGRRAETEV